MGFLNGMMLAGLAAASIPLIIHLLNRRRYRVIDWGAMRFLKFSVVTRHRRLRIEEILLLLLRTALIVALVIALARPFLTSGLFASADSRKDLVVILDASLSMSLKDSGASLFDRAREAARRAVGTLRPGDSVGVVLGTRAPRLLLPDLSYDFEKVDKALGRAHESLSSFDVLKALDHAFAMLRKGSNPTPEILIITDGQRHGWYTTDSNRWRYISEQLADFRRKPRIYVLTVDRHGAVANLALGEISLRRAVVGTDRDVRVSVNVRNTGDTGLGPQRLSFSVDGKGPRLTNVERLLPGASAPVAFTHRFTTSGSHYVVAELEQDTLALDDRAWFGLEVLDSLPVLLVDGSGSPDPMSRGTLFLETALEPAPQYVVRPTAVSPSSLAQTDLSRYRAVVLADVPQLSAGDVAKLEDFVHAGGGLLIAPGARVKPETYNTTLYKGGEGLLPAEMLSVEGDPASREKPFTLNLSGLTHETMQLLADPEKSDLHEALIWRYFKLAAPAGGTGSAVVLRLANGDPFIVEKDLGRGRVMLTAAPLDASWSNLFLRTSFVVLAHEMVYYLASPLIPARNVPAGEPLIVKLGETAPATEVDVTLPMGGMRTLPIERREGRRVAVLADTTEGGLYEVSYRGRPGEVKEYYVVNVEPEESDLTLLAASAKDGLTNRGLEFFSDWSRVEALLKAGHGMREFWRWLAILTVVMLIVEVALTRMFSRRRASEVQGISFGTNP